MDRGPPRTHRHRDRARPADPPRQPLHGRRPLGGARPPAPGPRRRPTQPRGRPLRRGALRRRTPPRRVRPATGWPAPGRPSLPHAPPARGGRTPRRRGPPAGDLLHLQPGRLHRRGPALPGRGAAPDRRRRTLPDPGPGRGACRDAERLRSRRSRLRPVARHPRSGGGRPPRRDGAGVPGGRRGLLQRGADQGRLRHRDPGPRHQHAGPVGGDREADQVQRRHPRVPDPRAVHPADGPRRPPGDRRPGHRGGPVVAVRHLHPDRTARRQSGVPAHLCVPPHLQHGGQPGAPLRPRRRPRRARPFLRPVPGRPCRGDAPDPARPHPLRARPARRPTRRRRRPSCGRLHRGPRHPGGHDPSAPGPTGAHRRLARGAEPRRRRVGAAS